MNTIERNNDDSGFVSEIRTESSVINVNLRKFLVGKLVGQELSQDEYVLVTAEATPVKTILALYDEYFGGNLSKLSQNALDNLRFPCQDADTEINDNFDMQESPDNQVNPDGTVQNVLTNIPATV